MSYSPISFQERYDLYKTIVDQANDLNNNNPPESDDSDVINYGKEVSKASFDLLSLAKDLYHHLSNDMGSMLDEKTDLYISHVNSDEEKEVFPYDDWINAIKDHGYNSDFNWDFNFNDFKKTLNFNIDTPKAKSLLVENTYAYLEAVRTNDFINFPLKYKKVINEIIKNKDVFLDFEQIIKFTDSIYTHVYNIENSEEKKYTLNSWTEYANIDLLEKIKVNEAEPLLIKLTSYIKDNPKNIDSFKANLINKFLFNIDINDYFFKVGKRNVRGYYNNTSVLEAINWEPIKFFVETDISLNMGLTDLIKEKMVKVIESNRYTIKKEKEDIEMNEFNKFIDVIKLKNKLTSTLPENKLHTKKVKI